MTTILKALPKGALETWKLKKAVSLALKGEKAWKGLPEGQDPVRWLIDAGEREALTAAAKGTNAHAFAEAYMLGLNPDITLLTKEEQYHAECFLQFVRDHQPKPILVEKVLTYIHPATNQPLYCGTMDLIAELAGPETPTDGDVWMVDYKASSSQPRASHALQAAAYVHATHYIEEDGSLHPMPKIDKAAVVLLNGGPANKCYRMFALDASEVVFSVFKDLLRIHNFDKIQDRVILGEV